MASTEINKALFDETIQINLDLARLDASTQKDVLRLLRRMERELIVSLGTDDLTAWGRRRLNQQLKESREIIRRYYAEIENTTLAATSGIAQVSSSSAAQALAVAVGTAETGVVAGLLPTTAFMEVLAGNSLVEGLTQKQWWGDLGDNAIKRFRQQIGLGLANAETNQDIIKRVRGAINISKSDATKLVRTSVMKISNDAREKTFEQNQDVIGSIEYVGTIDSKICAQCAPHDGLRWTYPDKKPIGHKIPYRSAPLHPNCRCSYVSITKTYRELGIDMDEVSSDTRASMDGFVEDKTFEDFMNRKGKAFTDDILGVGRSELYRNGTIKLEQLIDGRGNLLTLKQLQDKYL